MPAKHYPLKRILIIDEVTLIVAFFATLALRFGEGVLTWYQIFDGLYISFLLVLCIIQALIFFAYDSKKESIFTQDVFDNFTFVIRDKILLIAFVLLYLYSTQRGELASRFVVGVLFILSIIFDYIVRMLYKRHYWKHHAEGDKIEILDVWAPYPPVSEVIKEFSDGGYSIALVHQDATESNKLDMLLGDLKNAGIRTYVDTESLGYKVKSGIITDINGFAAVPVSVRDDKFDLFGINYAISRTEEAVLHVMRHLKDISGKYICFSNVHTTVMARENADYKQVLNEAAFVFPDGKPIAFLQQKKGLIGAERVAGPDFMEHMFRDTQDGKVSHFFYGSSQETLDALKENLLKKYPGLNIKGMYSPPFRALSEEEDQADVDMINNSGADILWVGLGAPKQEKWMNSHKGRINAVMMGVGAGFDFHAGTIKRAPKWIQKIGLEWLYRLFQDPKRLFKRYFVTNVKFIWYYIFGNTSAK